MNRHELMAFSVRDNQKRQFREGQEFLAPAVWVTAKPSSSTTGSNVSFRSDRQTMRRRDISDVYRTSRHWWNQQPTRNVERPDNSREHTSWAWFFLSLSSCFYSVAGGSTTAVLMSAAASAPFCSSSSLSFFFEGSGLSLFNADVLRPAEGHAARVINARRSPTPWRRRTWTCVNIPGTETERSPYCCVWRHADRVARPEPCCGRCHVNFLRAA